jgi:hypothetical protein
MAVLFNTASASSHIGTLCVIYKVLRRSKMNSMTLEKLTALCAPDTLAENQNHTEKFVDMVTFWGAEFHKIWSIDKDQKISLVHVTQNQHPTPENIAEIVRSALFETPIETITCHKKENKYSTEPLFVSLVCLLACDSHGPFDNFPITQGAIRDSLARWLGQGFALNDAEYAGLIEWLTFLGFVNQDHGKLVIDPTRAVKDSLKTIFNSQKTMPIREFIKSLGKILPVMDGGNYHQQTMDVMGVKQWVFNYEKQISSSLSLALHRLEIAAVIRIEPGADDVNSIEMLGPLGLPLRVISNITLRGGD